MKITSEKSNRFKGLLVFESIYNYIVFIPKIIYISINLLIYHIKNAIKERSFENFSYVSDLVYEVGLFAISNAKMNHLKRISFNPLKEQKRFLLKFLKDNKNTEFGKDHNFDKIHTIEDYQHYVKINDFTDLQPYVNRSINGEKNVLTKEEVIAFCRTSGTTGEQKLIPITAKQRADFKVLVRLYAYTIFETYPKAFEHKILTIVSSAHEGVTSSGLTYGSASGMLYHEMPSIIKEKYAIPSEVFEIEDYESRYFIILLLSIMEKISVIITANPSTVLLLAKKANDIKFQLIDVLKNKSLKNTKLHISQNIYDFVESKLEKHPEYCTQVAEKLINAISNNPDHNLYPKDYWPELSLISCWTGGNCRIFIQEMKAWYPINIPIHECGYLASEIRGSLPLWPNEKGGILTVSSNFYEFIHVSEIDEESPHYLTLDEIKLNEKYYVIVTTMAGLYRYNMHDIIQVVGFCNQTPVIVFVQKGKGITSITGEKIFEEQILLAMSQAEKKTDLKSRFFICLAKPEDKRYELFVEFEKNLLEMKQYRDFEYAFENSLQDINIEYKSKRESLRLNPLKLKLLDSNAFDQFRKFRINQGLREAQIKTIALTDDPELTNCLKLIA